MITFLNGKIRIYGEGKGASIESDIPREPWSPLADEREANAKADGALDGVESFLLALCCAGIQLRNEDPRINEALDSVMDGISNNSD